MMLIQKLSLLSFAMVISCIQEYPCQDSSDCLKKFNASSFCQIDQLGKGICVASSNAESARCVDSPLIISGMSKEPKPSFGLSVAVAQNQFVLIGEPGAEVNTVKNCGTVHLYKCNLSVDSCVKQNGVGPTSCPIQVLALAQNENSIGSAMVSDGTRFAINGHWYSYSMSTEGGWTQLTNDVGADVLAGIGLSLSKNEPMGPVVRIDIESGIPSIRVMRSATDHQSCNPPTLPVPPPFDPGKWTLSLDHQVLALGFGKDLAGVWSLPSRERGCPAPLVGWSPVVPPAGFQGQFGVSVALSGERLLIGGPRDVTEPSVYSYRVLGQSGKTMISTDPPSPVPLPRAMKAADIGLAPRDVGRTLAMDGDLLVVGAPQSSLHGPGNLDGAAFVYQYEPSKGTWIQISAITPPASLANGQLGSSVAIHDGLIAVGAPYANEQAGAVLVTRCTKK